MDVDNEATLQEYQIQLEQVELALRSDPDNEELLKLKQDLIEVIDLTKELMEDANEAAKSKEASLNWKSGDKCMAIWRSDGKYYSATIDQILDDGSCTVIFDGQSISELTQVGQLKVRTKNSNILSNESVIHKSSSAAAAKRISLANKKELELKLKEARKRKKEKFAAKMKALEEASEKDKNKWKSFNDKLSSRTWKGVVKKNKFELPEHHENKIGVGANRPSASSASSAAASINRHKAMRK